MTTSAWSTLSFATNHRKLSGINLEFYSFGYYTTINLLMRLVLYNY
jgi:hypothetical protein